VAQTSARQCDQRLESYGAAKAALLHVSRNLALRYTRDGVLTSFVLPGLTCTDGVLERYDAAAAMTRTPADIEPDGRPPADRDRTAG
jgi:NAD(P)-dependent dehydrogenase (short-subunit alcohol dehydrogenase family)